MPHTPQFRALALFGRRLPKRVDGLGVPASENLHKRRQARLGLNFPIVRCYPKADKRGRNWIVRFMPEADFRISGDERNIHFPSKPLYLRG